MYKFFQVPPIFCHRLLCSFNTLWAWNCAFLVANATKNLALETWISQLVPSGRVTILCHDNYIILYKQNSKSPANWSLIFYCTYSLLLKAPNWQPEFSIWHPNILVCVLLQGKHFTDNFWQPHIAIEKINFSYQLTSA